MALLEVTVERVELRQVSKIFGAVVALRGVNLRFEGGGVTALAGHNGAGKTTLLGLLSTLVRPTTGEVLFDGAAASRRGAALRGEIGFAAEQPLGYGELTGRENVVLQARAHHLPAPAARAAAVLEALGLAQLADRPASGYSQGELRRLGLARALVHEPRLLLLDEPTSGLDVAGAVRLVELLRARAAAGAILIISTHDPWLGAELADRVVSLRRGAVVGDGPAPGGAPAWRELLGAAT